MAWEIVREGPSKHKIEIDWSNIIGIEAAIEDHRQGILQLEVSLINFYFFVPNWFLLILFKMGIFCLLKCV